MKLGYVPPGHTITREEIEARNKAQDEDMGRIREFLSEASARKYIEASDRLVEVELKDTVIIPEFDEDELKSNEVDEDISEEERDFMAQLFGNIKSLAGKTGGELARLNPKTEKEYVEDVAKVRWHLTRHWLSVLSAGHYRTKEKAPGDVLRLQDNLFPEETAEEVERRGGSNMGYMQRDLAIGGICYDDLANACYAEFVANVKTYLAAHPEGLVLSSYDNTRLFKEGDQYVVR